jgi:DNA-binding response OmpR family regulator
MKHMMSPSSLHILIIEDNDSLREATIDFLNVHGHNAMGVASAEEVDDLPMRDVPDLYLIDINLPGESGFSLTQRIRKIQPLAGIVLMTARAHLHDRLDGYNRGADNYLIKPVEQTELLACIDSLAFRLKATNPPTKSGLVLNSHSMCLSGPAGEVALTHGEKLLLVAFCRAAGQKLERWQVMQLVDNKCKGLLTANLEMRISSLRKKLSQCGASDKPIQALRGFGYALNCQIEVR